MASINRKFVMALWLSLSLQIIIYAAAVSVDYATRLDANWPPETVLSILVSLFCLLGIVSLVALGVLLAKKERLPKGMFCLISVVVILTVFANPVASWVYHHSVVFGY